MKVKHMIRGIDSSTFVPKYCPDNINCVSMLSWVLTLKRLDGWHHMRYYIGEEEDSMNV